jgi:hypothetical protein
MSISPRAHMITPVDWSIVHNSARLNRRFEQS